MTDMQRATSDSPLRFAWPVAGGGYSWRRDLRLWTEKASGIPGDVRRAPEGPWLLDPGSGGAAYEGRYWHPLRERHDLHVEFAQLPLGDGEEELAALAAFASRNGLLGIEEQRVVTTPGENPDKGVYAGEHLASWQRAIREMSLLVELAVATQGHDSGRLRGLVEWYGGGRGVRISYAFPGDEEPTKLPILRDVPTLTPDERKKLERWRAASGDQGRYGEPAAFFLNRELNRLLREQLSVQLPLGGSIELRPESLYGAMLVLLAEQLSGTWRVNTCKACGRLFVPRHRRDQATCSDACRKRLSRQKAAS